MELPGHLLQKIHAHARSHDAARLMNTSKEMQKTIALNNDVAKNHPYREVDIKVDNHGFHHLQFEFSPDSKTVYIVDYKGLNAYDVVTGSLKSSFDVRPSDMAVSHSGGLVACYGSLHGKFHDTYDAVKLFDTKTTKSIKLYGAPNNVAGHTPKTVAFSHDDKLIACLWSRRLMVWNVATGSTVYDNDGEFYDGVLTFSPVRYDLAVQLETIYGAVRRAVFIVNLDGASPEVSRIYTEERDGYDQVIRTTYLKFTPDGESLLYEIMGHKGIGKYGGIGKYAISSKKTEMTLVYNGEKDPEQYTTYDDFDISPDGRYVAAITSDRVLIWNMATNKVIQRNEIRADADGFVFVRFLPDGKSFVTVYDKERLNLWTIGSNKPTTTYHRKLPKNRQIDYGIGILAYTFGISPDGSILAVRDTINSLRLIRLKPIVPNQFYGGVAAASNNKHKHTNGKTYTVRVGKRGGRYILVGKEQNKVYV